MAAKDMLGVEFGLLTVTGRAKNKSDGTAAWDCRCVCGERRTIAGTALRAGRHKSCGCMSPRFTRERVKTHGMSYTKTYRVWAGMHARCSPSARGKSKRLYFDKGIRVCERWDSFEMFLEDMGECPWGLSIEREDGSLDYAPGNCRWATSREQANNTTRNVIIQWSGKTQTISMWASEIGVKPNTLLYRIRRGMSVERAMRLRTGL